jgi:hypothetical protein
MGRVFCCRAEYFLAYTGLDEAVIALGKIEDYQV